MGVKIDNKGECNIRTYAVPTDHTPEMAALISLRVLELLRAEPWFTVQASLGLAELCRVYPLAVRAVISELAKSGVASTQTLLSACDCPEFLLACAPTFMQTTSDETTIATMLRTVYQGKESLASELEARILQVFASESNVAILPETPVLELLANVLKLTQSSDPSVAAYGQEFNSSLHSITLWYGWRHVNGETIGILSDHIIQPTIAVHSAFWGDWLVSLCKQVGTIDKVLQVLVDKLFNHANPALDVMAPSLQLFPRIIASVPTESSCTCVLVQLHRALDVARSRCESLLLPQAAVAFTVASQLHHTIVHVCEYCLIPSASEIRLDVAYSKCWSDVVNSGAVLAGSSLADDAIQPFLTMIFDLCREFPSPVNNPDVTVELATLAVGLLTMLSVRNVLIDQAIRLLVKVSSTPYACTLALNRLYVALIDDSSGPNPMPICQAVVTLATSLPNGQVFALAEFCEIVYPAGVHRGITPAEYKAASPKLIINHFDVDVHRKFAKCPLLWSVLQACAGTPADVTTTSKLKELVLSGLCGLVCHWRAITSSKPVAELSSASSDSAVWLSSSQVAVSVLTQLRLIPQRCCACVEALLPVLPARSVSAVLLHVWSIAYTATGDSDTPDTVWKPELKHIAQQHIASTFEIYPMLL